MLRYVSSVELLTPQGRLLILLAAEPDLEMRFRPKRLGPLEPACWHAPKDLIAAGLVTK